MNVTLVDLDELRRVIADEVTRAVRSILDSRDGDDSGDGLLTAKDLAAMLRVSKRDLRRMVLDGTIPAPIKLGSRRVRWRQKTVEAFIGKLERKALDAGAKNRLHVRVDTADLGASG